MLGVCAECGMYNKELFKQMKHGSLPFTIQNIRTVCDPVLKALDVEQKNIEVFDFETRNIPISHNIDEDTGNLVSVKFVNAIEKGARINKFYGVTFCPKEFIKGYNQQMFIYLDITKTIPQTELFKTYGHEVGHITQINGKEPYISLELVEKVKEELNEQAGKVFFTDINLLKSVLKEYVAYSFEREFAREFFDQYKFKFEKNAFTEFRVPNKFRLPNVLGRSELNNTAVVCQYLGKKFIPLETLPYYKPGYEGKIPYRSDEGELWL